MLNRFLLIALLICTAVNIIGCAVNRNQTLSNSAERQKEKTAVVTLNDQIETFNRANPSSKPGVSLVEQRVSRVRYNPKLDQVVCFDEKGNEFLVLKREADGRFKGTLEVDFHEAAFSDADEYYEWGKILVEFYLDFK